MQVPLALLVRIERQPIRKVIDMTRDSITGARLDLSEREAELLRGMLKVQLGHAARCDQMTNIPMAIRQKSWDMERVELLRKLLKFAGHTEMLDEAVSA